MVGGVSKEQFRRWVFLVTPGFINYDPDVVRQVEELSPDLLHKLWLASTQGRKHHIMEIARGGGDVPKNLEVSLRALLLGPEREAILAIRPDWATQTLAERKAELIRMAESGVELPEKANVLRRIFFEVSRKGARGFDPVFYEHIERVRPDWLVPDESPNWTVLRDLAESGASRPHSGTRLGRVITNLQSGTGSKAKAFLEEIRQLRPDWFAEKPSRKTELLAIARSGAPRPAQREGTLGTALCGLTQSRSATYDPEFTALLRELRPDWFRDLTRQRWREEVLKVAREGGPKPDTNTTLGKRFDQYAYDLNDELAKEIRALRPEWFRNIVHDHKFAELLRIAQEGGNRPSGKKNKLADALVRLTKDKDSDRLRLLQELRPDWFKNPKITKHEALRELALSGAPRPRGNSQMGDALSRYLQSKHDDDRQFMTEIQTMRPDWFRDADRSRARVIELARSGAPRPLSDTADYRVLYGNLKSNPEFAETIKSLRPDWLIKSTVVG